MPQLFDDRELLTAFREGQRHALERVYREYVHQVAKFVRCGFGYRVAGKPAAFAGYHQPYDLDSTVQEVFARAFSPQTLASYDGLRPYGAFLRGIARNIILDRLRKRARSGEVLEESPEHEDPDANTAVEQTIDEKRGTALVRDFLHQACDARDRELYALRFDEDSSQKGAAEALGLTRIQVRRWETKFRARLLRYLKRARYRRTP